MAYQEDEEQEEQGNNRKLRKAIENRMRQAQAEQQRKEVMKKLLEPAAYDRLMNVRVANPDLYAQLIDLIISLAQQNRINGRLTEGQLVAILQKVTVRPDTKLEYKRK